MKHSAKRHLLTFQRILQQLNCNVPSNIYELTVKSPLLKTHCKCVAVGTKSHSDTEVIERNQPNFKNK